MTVAIRKVGGKQRRFRKTALKHRPSGEGKGRWQNKTVFWASKIKARHKRRISETSRKINRAA
jgi:hypothetical protein